MIRKCVFLIIILFNDKIFKLIYHSKDIVFGKFWWLDGGKADVYTFNFLRTLFYLLITHNLPENCVFWSFSFMLNNAKFYQLKYFFSFNSHVLYLYCHNTIRDSNKAFHKCILGWFFLLNVFKVYPVHWAPLICDISDELRAVIHSYLLGFTLFINQVVKHPNYSVTGQWKINLYMKGLSVKIINDIKCSKTSLLLSCPVPYTRCKHLKPKV